MIEKAKKHKMGTISEEDISTLLQRYTATTVLALLQEVAQFPDVNIDWNALVKKTSTGISNAREYQMLWRHLAYRHTLIEKLQDGAEPQDDDSDLEYELEPCPAVSSEASTEAAACVKVLIASGLPSESNLPNCSTVEAPLTINIPNGQSFRAHLENSQQACSMQGVNITVPVSVQKQPLPTGTPAEGSDANGIGSGSIPPRRKRKPWSAAEDLELLNAVSKFGEGNWANILKGEFKGDRTASQLSQRWAIIRKRRGNLNIAANSTGAQLSEVLLAARHAMSVALKPMANLRPTSSVGTAGTSSNNVSSNSAFPLAPAEVGSSTPQCPASNPQGPASTPQCPASTPQGPASTPQGPAPRIGTSGSVPKPRLPAKKISTKSTISPNSMVKATAVAAGARIATPEDAASLLKAAQAKNAVHIMPGGGTLIKSSMSGGASSSPSSHLGPQHNVHYGCTGLAATPLSTYSAPSTLRPGSSKPAAPYIQSTNAMSSEQTNTGTTDMVIELPSNQDAKTSEEIKVPNSGNGPNEQVQADQVCQSGNAAIHQGQEDAQQRNQVQKGQAALPVLEPVAKNELAVLNEPKKFVLEDQESLSENLPIQGVQSVSPVPEAVIRNQLVVDENHCSSLITETAEKDQATIVGNQAADSQNVNGIEMMDFEVEGAGEDQFVVKKGENGSMNEKQTMPSLGIYGSCDKIEEVRNEAVAANGS